ncbi:uncharacterized protein LOC130623620 isoform X2 [Hydractinia symbiolongicarpus]|uniref:uncharacterized protein LOC130623620 isoform X2 n=1 Tax=Hydractinia symbiolongicarpus TaxID=13093 RepID=UPI002551A9E3|nr:uncharacterized protein LOC130623620 isoform X2 [Hydractinia symbiolongicarpus]
MVLFDTEIILLVEYLNMRKRIKVFDTDDLKELIETAFSASPVKLPQEYLVQCFDSEIQDYLDLDDEKVLEVNNKIKILPVYDVSLNESLSRSFNEPCAAQPDMNKENDESSSKNEKLVKEPDENVEKLSTFSCGSSSNTKPWPHPFIIKDKMVRPSTLKLLQQKVKLTTADVTSLFSSILDEVIEYTYYPTPWQYMELTMAILVKWPHLMNAYPTELDAKWAWKKKLREFFRNTRKRKCGQLPEIILMKSKFSKQPKKDAAHEIKGAVRSSNVWGVKNHLPACDPGEDDEPWRCIDEPRTLVKQYNVHHYNRKMSVLQVAMNKTFSWRRKLIIEDGCSVAELFDKFPLLKEPRQQIFEPHILIFYHIL